MNTIATLAAGMTIALTATRTRAADADPLAPWREGVTIRQVAPTSDRHSIHSYFNVNPESPDGRYVLYYTSATDDGEHGDIRVLERATGHERVLVTDLHSEDAHRVACQQWLSNGRRVTYHTQRGDRWVSMVADVETGEQKVVAEDRLTGWGTPTGDELPLYGLHWNPSAHRDLEFANVATGEVRTVVTNDAVRARFPEWFAKTYGDNPTSIFFPVLSPDGNRVFFKMSTPKTNDPRSPEASDRQGRVVYDLRQQTLLSVSDTWGHPSWRNDSRTILEAHNLVVDSADGSQVTIPGLPDFGSGHPSTDPTGTLFVTDVTTKRFGGPAGEWAIALCNMRGGQHLLIHTFDNTGGAKSWRIPHPHPRFSADGRRIYFNVSDGPRTKLFVAERAN